MTHSRWFIGTMSRAPQ